MFQINVNLKGKILEGRAGPELNRRLRATLEKTAQYVKEEVARQGVMPVGVTGDARRGVSKDIKLTELTAIIHETGPAAKYIEVLEKGRRGGPDQRFPNITAIRRWLELTDKGKAFKQEIKQKYFSQHAAKAKRNKAAKASLEERILDTATFLKARAIARYGTPAQRMYETAYKKTKNWVINQFQKTISDFAKSP